MTRYAQHVSTRVTPQSERAHPKQVKNYAGGYSFKIDKWSALDRWLILGADGGTYYASEKKLTKENATTIQACLDENGPKTVSRIVEISEAGRAPKNDPAIFALALASGHSKPKTRKAALDALPKVCRIGTHLFQFLDSVKGFRGWGRGLRRAVSNWYTTKAPDRLAYQVVKYQGRGGVSHRDVLRLAGGGVGPRSAEVNAVLRYVVAGMDGMGARTVTRFETRGDKVLTKGGKPVVASQGSYPAIDPEALPKIIHGWEAMKKATTPAEAIELIREYRLTHEMVLNQFKKDPGVWEALLPGMPMGALVRNLGNMSKCGFLAPMSAGSKAVVAKLSDAEAIQKARLHPLAILVALNTYKSGQGVKGSAIWTPVPQVIDALDEAFYMAFKGIEPTGKNRLVALDVSGSMGWGTIAGMPGITPRVGSAAMAMTTIRTESNYHVVGFTSSGGNYENGISTIDLSKRMRLDDVIRKISGLPVGATDCALPMLWATSNNVEVDAFEILTDNETWAGYIHPHQALEIYRQKMGRPAKLIVVGMTATNFSIANPDDTGMLDVVGFDTATPNIMADFIRYGFDERK